MLNRLWQSTIDLHKRFYPDTLPSLEARLRVFTEEYGEFLHAIYTKSTRECELECADLIVTAIGLLDARGSKPEYLDDAIAHVIDKNDNKTLETHTLGKNGKITRK